MFSQISLHTHTKIPHTDLSVPRLSCLDPWSPEEPIFDLTALAASLVDSSGLPAVAGLSDGASVEAGSTSGAEIDGKKMGKKQVNIRVIPG